MQGHQRASVCHLPKTCGAVLFFFYVRPHEVSAVFCIARFLYINSIHIYTKRDVLWKSMCACHSAIGAMCKYYYLGALKSGMTEQDTGALSTERFFVLCCCASRLLVKALLSRLFVCPLCVLIAWQAGSFAVALCLLYIRHKTESPMSPSGNEHSTTDRPGNVQYEF